jgi:hypothetical protein
MQEFVRVCERKDLSIQQRHNGSYRIEEMNNREKKRENRERRILQGIRKLPTKPVFTNQ